MSRILSLALAVLAAGASHLRAQGGGLEVTEGRLVRVHLADGRVMTAAFLAATGDSVTLLRGGADTLRVARTDIVGTEAFVRKSSVLATTAMVGAGVGMLAGVAIGAGSCEDDWLMSEGDCILFTGLAYGGIGAMAGLVVGLFMPTKRWEPAMLPTVQVLPDGSGGTAVRLGARLRL